MEYDTNEIRIRLSSLTGLDAMYIKVEKFNAQNLAKCCWVYKITIADKKNGDIKPDDEKDDMEQALQQQGDGDLTTFEVEEESSSASTAIIPMIVVAAALVVV